MSDYENCLELIKNAEIGKVIKLHSPIIFQAIFEKTNSGYTHTRRLYHGQDLSSIDLNRHDTNKGYFKTLSSCKRSFLHNFKICYFNSDGSFKNHARVIISSLEDELMTLES